jgi:hypothetical protein
MTMTRQQQLTPIPRRVGWLLMALAVLVGWGGRSMGVTHYGPFPAVAVMLLVGGIGVMLVVTDIMVRGMYAQVGAAAQSEAAAAGDAAVRPDGNDVAVGGDLDRA